MKKACRIPTAKIAEQAVQDVEKMLGKQLSYLYVRDVLDRLRSAMDPDKKTGERAHICVANRALGLHRALLISRGWVAESVWRRNREWFYDLPQELQLATSALRRGEVR